MCTLFSLCLGCVKARSSANILLQSKNVFQQNKDKKTFFFSLWIELLFLEHCPWRGSTVSCSQLLPYSSSAPQNFAGMNSTVHGSVCYPHGQIHISHVTQHFFSGCHTFSFLCPVLHLPPCLHLFPPPVLPFESSSVMSVHCVLLSHTLPLLSCFFVPHRKLHKWGFSWCCSSTC